MNKLLNYIYNILNIDLDKYYLNIIQVV